MRGATKLQSDEATKGNARARRDARLSFPSSLRRSVAASLARSGFSFAEVMFAVVVLGIGFIMVAAIFPVAIKQTQLNTEETVAVAVAKGGVNVMLQAGAARNPNKRTGINGDTVTAPLLPRTDVLDFNSGQQLSIPGSGSGPFRFGKLASLRDRRFDNELNTALNTHVNFQRDGMWRAISANLIQPTDPRFAWVPLYIREVQYSSRPGASDEVAPYARLVLFGCAVRNRTTYDAADYTPYLPASNPNAQPEPSNHFVTLEPKPVAVQVKLVNPANSDEGYCIKFFSVRGLGGSGGHAAGGFPSLGSDDAVYARFASEAVGEGSFVVISDDRIIERGTSDQISLASGRMNGLVLRVGVRRPELDEGGTFPKYAWSLMPGYEFTPHPGPDGVFAGPAQDDINRLGVDDSGTYGDVTINGVRTLGDNIAFMGGAQQGCVAYIMGRGYTNPRATPGMTGADSQYDGPTQDVAVYTTYIPVK